MQKDQRQVREENIQTKLDTIRIKDHNLDMEMSSTESLKSIKGLQAAMEEVKKVMVRVRTKYYYSNFQIQLHNIKEPLFIQNRLRVLGLWSQGILKQVYSLILQLLNSLDRQSTTYLYQEHLCLKREQVFTIIMAQAKVVRHILMSHLS